jgi:hypothetical protein
MTKKGDKNMAKYDVQEVDYEDMTPEEAASAIEKVKTDIFEDPKHPYLDSEHPQHGAFVEHMSNLCKARVRKEGEPFDPEVERAEQAAQYEEEQQVLRQNNLIADAEKEMDALVELGFDRDEIPNDVQQWQVESLKMERLNSEGNLRELSPMLEPVLKDLGLLGDLNLYRSFVLDATIDPKSRAKHIELILERMYKANKKKNMEANNE